MRFVIFQIVDGNFGKSYNCLSNNNFDTKKISKVTKRFFEIEKIFHVFKSFRKTGWLLYQIFKKSVNFI